MENINVQSGIAELRRRRLVSQSGIPAIQTEAEVNLLTKYQKPLSISDLSNLEVRVADESGRLVRVVVGEVNGSWKVDSSKLDCDVFVFYGAAGFSGWMLSKEVENAPEHVLQEQEDKGKYKVMKDVGSYFGVSDENFFPMPETFDFKAPCVNIPCDAAGVWDWPTDCWDCFMCGKKRYDKASVQWWEDYKSK